MQEITTTYQTDGRINLKIHLFIPESTKRQRAAILFFHGGRFCQGHPAQFFPHCRYFASRGMVAASATYRLLRDNASSVLDCLADSRAAIRWLRHQAVDLAIDPAKIVVAGGSAGANLAANAAMYPTHNQSTEELTTSSKPNAAVLFSPAIVHPIPGEDLIDERLYHRLQPRPNLPPMLPLHGAADEVFSCQAIQDFYQAMIDTENQCYLELYPNGKHGFFNYNQEDNRFFAETVTKTEWFLRELDLLHSHSVLSKKVIDTLRQDDDWIA